LEGGGGGEEEEEEEEEEEDSSSSTCKIFLVRLTTPFPCFSMAVMSF